MTDNISLWQKCLAVQKKLCPNEITPQFLEHFSLFSLTPGFLPHTILPKNCVPDTGKSINKVIHKG